MLIIILFKGAIKFQQKLNLILSWHLFNLYIYQYEKNVLIKNNSGQSLPLNAFTQTFEK